MSAASRRLPAALVILVAAIPLLFACGGRTGSSPKTGSSPTPDAFERIERPSGYSLHLPPNQTKQPFPLVVALHQLFGSGEEIEESWGLDALADRDGFAVLYPNGLVHSWNAGDCCGKAAQVREDDVGYLRALIAHVGRIAPIDEHRVVLFGLSNGGMLAFRYACEHPEEIAGIGVVSASLQYSPCQPAVPTTVVAISGLLDLTVPPEGDPYSKLLGTRVTSQTDSLAPFQAADRCAAPYPPAASDPSVPAGTGALDRARGVGSTGQASAQPTMRESICADGARVVSYQLPRGGHGWQRASRQDPFDDGVTLWNILSGARSPSTVPDL